MTPASERRRPTFPYRRGRRMGWGWLIVAHLSTDASVGHYPADPGFSAADGDYGIPTLCGKRGHLTFDRPRTGRICLRCTTASSRGPNPGEGSS